MPLRLEPLTTEQIASWDTLTAHLPRRQVFHRQAWFNCLTETQHAEWRYWAVTNGGRTVGYFAGGIVKRGPFRILGSPLRTWHTTNMGPLLEDGVDGKAFVAALDELAREEQLAMVEIEYPSMPHQAFEEGGFSFHQTWTNQLPLSPDYQAMLKRMSRGRRYGIHLAEQNGLEVVECEDAGFRVHDQLSRAMEQNGMTCPFSADLPQAIVRNLKPLGLVYTLGVRNPENNMVAAGIFPVDNGTVYLWDSSCELKGRRLHPHDLLHWGLMRRASEQGNYLYDMSGYGRFNKAFGAKLVATYRWNKCYSASARIARAVYEQILMAERHSATLGRLLRPLRA